ncbi:MAG: lipoprotein carrier protein LolA [Desulfobacterales bacterium CG23_combo_of_CG06-09_8_20_14_all_51_8]|nr:MAG: lipoprotein carrier protein LolA [Desulfobacterales bacterium CG23_combo_of_CG06-09_8_20_14_all_51_8]
MEKIFLRIILMICLIISFETGIFASETTEAEVSATPASPPSHETLLEKLGARYNAADFSARFHQESLLKALDITDKAAGKVWFKHPGMMRWEYEQPEKYAIISDGKTLWIYRPEDNQVVIGDAMTYFSNGKGASFLSNFKLVQDAYTVTLAEPDNDDRYTLKLVPRKKQLDLAAIFLNVDKRTFDIKSVRTLNDYNDETRIEFSDLKFEATDPDLFHFRIPPGADILKLDE